MDFIEATERLKRCVTDEDIAGATGVSVNTIRRTRAERATRNYRPAPSGWEKAIARLARVHGRKLIALADELDTEDVGA